MAEDSWQIEKVKRFSINGFIKYDIYSKRLNTAVYQVSGEDFSESELQLIMRRFGVSKPEDLVGVVYDHDQFFEWTSEIRDSTWRKEVAANGKKAQDEYNRINFSESAPMLSSDFSSFDIGSDQDTLRGIEKAIWDGNQLEVSVLISLNCAVTGIQGIARLNGDRVELTLETQYPPNQRAMCDSVYRCKFKIKDLKKKDYRIAFRCGLWTAEAFLSRDVPIINVSMPQETD